MSHYQIIIVDDHPLFRGALRQALSEGIEGLTIFEAGSLDELLKALGSQTETDLILLDLAMPGVKGYSGLIYLRAQHPEIPVVVVSARDEPAAVRRCIEFGASGFIPKSLSVDAIREAVKAVLSGVVWTPPDINLEEPAADEVSELTARLASLTPQQVRVLMMLAEGLLNKQIAYELGVSEATVKAHVSAILQKLGVDSRTQAVITLNKIENGNWPKAMT